MGLIFDSLRSDGSPVVILKEIINGKQSDFIMRVGTWKDFVKKLSDKGIKFSQFKNHFDVDELVNVFWMDDLWGKDDYKDIMEWLDEIRTCFDIDRHDIRFDHIVQHYKEFDRRGKNG